MQGHGLGRLGYRNESNSTTNASFATGCCTILKWLALAVLITRGRGSISPSPSRCRGGFRATRKQLRYAPENCSTPAFLDTEDEPWWQTESLLMEKTTSEPVGGQQSSLPQATCARTPPAPTSSSNRQQSRLAPATLSHPPPPTSSSNQQQPRLASATLFHPPPATPPTTPASSSIQHSDFLTAEEMILIRISSSSI